MAEDGGQLRRREQPHGSGGEPDSWPPEPAAEGQRRLQPNNIALALKPHLQADAPSDPLGPRYAAGPNPGQGQPGTVPLPPAMDERMAKRPGHQRQQQRSSDHSPNSPGLPAGSRPPHAADKGGGQQSGK